MAETGPTFPGLRVPEIFLPAKEIDLRKWAVVACDQYTSQPEYWEETARLVGEAPSTLHLILPEVYLGKAGESERIADIHRRMREYLADGILEPCGPGFVLVDRWTARSGSRKGLVVAVDLDCYDFRPGARTLIRATEGTVLERIPPRVRIRKGAPLELPHVMLLIDDPGRTIIEPLAAEDLPLLYETDLMQGGGHVRGFKVDRPDLLASIAAALANLADRARAASGYGSEAGAPFLFAVGDGNHSLATAKAVWEELKAEGRASADHPARFALVELVNLHGEGLKFEPIHRVIFGYGAERLLSAMSRYYGPAGGFATMPCAPGELAAAAARLRAERPAAHCLAYQAGGQAGVAVVERPRRNLEAGTLQDFLDDLARTDPGLRVDYIHGEAQTAALAAKEGNIGFYLPALPKEELFRTILADGVLPKKTFSMGEAEEKRYYLECRRIT